MINLDKSLEVISDITGYDVEQIEMSNKLIDDLGFDSIMLMDLYHSIFGEEDNIEKRELLKDIVNSDITIEELAKALGIEGIENTYPKQNTKIDNFQEVEWFAEYFDSLNEVPYFRKSDGIASNHMIIEGEEKINYSTYNYLGLNGDPRVNEYAKKAIDKYGTSVSGSRLLSGEIELHEKLEQLISSFLGVEDSLVLVGGHATNVNIIGCVVGEKDLILHDQMAHNSIIQGAILSHAKRKPFKHNDMERLENELIKLRKKFRRVLIVVEGVYSMDGDICNLPDLLRIKEKYGAILMIDEAHSLGTIGKEGRGVTSYFGIDPNRVDIMMGTLSKSAASCGGYIAGSRKFIKHLRYNLEGFIFSCGCTPSNTAAAYKAIQLFMDESERVEKLNENSKYFLNRLKECGFDTGLSCDTPVVPIMIGDSKKALHISKRLYDKGVNALPIIYPAVKEDEARLRFFMSSSHTKEDMDRTVEMLKVVYEEIEK